MPELEKERGGHNYPMGRDVVCTFNCGCWIKNGKSEGPKGVDPLGKCPRNTTIHSEIPPDDDVLIVKKKDAAKEPSALPDGLEPGETPADAEDLFTKKYVDDDVMMTPEEAVKQSATFMHPSISTALKGVAPSAPLAQIISVSKSLDQQQLIITLSVSLNAQENG